VNKTELPPLLHMMKRLIAEPSVSSVSAEWDQSNVRVIDLLQDWLHNLGFQDCLLKQPGSQPPVGKELQSYLPHPY